MYGIWDFTDYLHENLLRIEEHCVALEKLGIEQNDDMMAELKAEIRKKERKI
jgi:hypothetical protein